MATFFTKFFYCFLFVSLANYAMGQAKFSASANPLQASVNEYITYKLTVTNGENVESITPPSFNNFILISGPNQETSMNVVNGSVTKSISLTYILQPKKTGNTIIAYGSAIVDGKPFKSNSINIVVNNKKSTQKNPQQNKANTLQQMLSSVFDDPFAAQPASTTFSDYIIKPGENIPEKVSKNMQLKLQTNKTTCYVGEPIIAEYKLLSRLKSESSLAKNPSFNGFSVIDMMGENDGTNYTTDKLNGRQCNAYVIRKVQLYPLQAGALELEPATLDNSINFVKYSGGNNNSYTIDPNAMVTEKVSLSSKPQTILVKPLPDAAKPNNFNGAVGNFEIDVQLQKNNFTTTETGKLLVTISGEGNMQLLTAPTITWPSNIEIFDTKITDNTNTTTVPLSGSKTFEIPFAVSNVGKYNTPQISFSFFNPITASYKTISSAPIAFEVTKGNGITASNTVTKNKTLPQFSLLEKVTANRWMVILLIIGIVIFGLILFIGKDKKQPQNIFEEKKIIEEEKPITFIDNYNPLAKTEECLSQPSCTTFYVILQTELKEFFAQYFKISIENINSNTITAIMDKASISNTISLQTQQLLQDIEWQLYTPFERNEKLNEMYATAHTIVQGLMAKNA